MMNNFKNYILHDRLLIMEQDPSSDEQIRDILSLNKVAVVGMSKNPSKAAHYVPKYLFENGYDITPVNPYSDEILGKKSYNSVSDVVGDVDIVDVFRPSDQVLPVIREAIKKKPKVIWLLPVIREAIKKKPKVIWLQEGIHNLEAEELARSAGIKVVFNRCMLAEHQRLLR
jgi:predicted CoA-binding protein